jgi:hypothetical protein
MFGGDRRDGKEVGDTRRVVGCASSKQNCELFESVGHGSRLSGPGFNIIIQSFSIIVFSLLPCPSAEGNWVEVRQ